MSKLVYSAEQIRQGELIQIFFINHLFPITCYNLLVQTQEKWKNKRENEKKKKKKNSV